MATRKRRGLVLASRSPQRRAILEQLGVEFDVAPADVEELESGDPVEVAKENARRKAAAVEGELVLGVDTVVALDGRIYGKPADADDAARTLRALSGRTHEVISGLALGDEVTAATTRVTFRTLDDDLVRWYVATGEWRDRAGGYAIQGRGAALVVAIDGDYLNVVGLPVAQLLARAPWLVWGAR
ncbi:MAG TPA: Maf family protein [Solirubrobacteraceae bacterium]|nr:Maf family protein [Solirubrobacteraceae bacterium]